MSMADLIPMLLATRMEQTAKRLSDKEKSARNRKYNKRRDQWRAQRRAKGLPVT